MPHACVAEARSRRKHARNLKLQNTGPWWQAEVVKGSQMNSFALFITPLRYSLHLRARRKSTLCGSHCLHPKPETHCLHCRLLPNLDFRAHVAVRAAAATGL